MLAAILIGAFLGFFGSMPIAGPIAVLVMTKGLDGKRRSGLFIAIGAGLVESGYACVAYLGLTAVLENYPLVVPASRIVGSLILLALGLYFIFRKPRQQKPEAQKGDDRSTRPFGAFLFGSSITAVNPTLIVTWTAAVGAAHSTGLLRFHPLDAFPFAGGVATGIIGWFSLFLWLLSHFRQKLNESSLDRIIRVIGVLLVLGGLAFGARTVVHLVQG